MSYDINELPCILEAQHLHKNVPSYIQKKFTTSLENIKLGSRTKDYSGLSQYVPSQGNISGLAK